MSIFSHLACSTGLLLATSLATPAPAAEKFLPAFPGAEGHGAKPSADAAGA